jgi:hypothetical protein
MLAMQGRRAALTITIPEAVIDRVIVLLRANAASRRNETLFGMVDIRYSHIQLLFYLTSCSLWLDRVVVTRESSGDNETRIQNTPTFYPSELLNV